MRRVLLTGGSGFVGQYVARAAVARGDAVWVTGFDYDTAGWVTVYDEDTKRINYLTIDITRQSQVNALVEGAQPDVVIHLAGVAFPPEAERDPGATFDINTTGVVRLLSALAKQRDAGGRDPSVVVVGSALQYGVHDAAAMPLSESAEQRPITAYAASKAAQEIAALQIARFAGLRVICTRSFNHSGAGQSSDYLMPSLVRRALALRENHGGTLSVGNDALRDFLHVADVAEAYLTLADRGVSGEVYNVASGKGVRVSELAADILRRAGVSAEVSSDPSLARATDIPVLIGSPAKLMEHTGWAPIKTHADIIDDLLRFANAETD